MTDAEKIVAYKAAYKDLLATFFKYYNTTKLYGVCFCETCCPVGWKKCGFYGFDSHCCGERILAQYLEDDES